MVVIEIFPRRTEERSRENGRDNLLHQSPSHSQDLSRIQSFMNLFPVETARAHVISFTLDKSIQSKRSYNTASIVKDIGMDQVCH